MIKISRYKGRAGRKRRGILILLLLLAGGILFFWDQQNRIQTEIIPVTDPALPAAFDGFSIALISDLHGKEFGAGSETLLTAVEELEPDLIAITGDLIDQREQLSMVPALAAGLSAIAPTYYVTGNHEWAAKCVNELKELLRANGVTVLENETLPLEREGEMILLAGIEDPNGYADQKTLPQLAVEILLEYGDPFVVLLAHRNTEHQLYSDCRMDLTLSGHGHGGVIRLPFTDGLLGNDHTLFPSYTAGLYQLEGGQMVVSRGLGSNTETAPRFRLFNRPHLPLVILQR